LTILPTFWDKDLEPTTWTSGEKGTLKKILIRRKWSEKTFNAFYDKQEHIKSLKIGVTTKEYTDYGVRNADDTQVEKKMAKIYRKTSKAHHSRKTSTYIPHVKNTYRQKNTRLLRQLRSDVKIIILSEWKCLHSNIIRE
jgi:hypothetical protein